ncbi:sugar phosphate isomerase/epimerase family protein [Brachybacterium sacelli]|uniref:Sugar phosphate isomerase/epimerase n=1 Tax=Brachybacterium sacelli TaxID=173364 RepID=A0ABS4WXS8_9MICO|nr:TIM barrel protein [Brachybacterium sacelli]MBP2380319.1 sugar phosphate isomerase/epimerase [Brachybacterium sacelli]
MIRPGLCSVTFRELAVDRVVELAAGAGLECIEWAGDAHVPPGDTVAAERARTLTEQAGLAVASYGSYLRFEGSDEEFSGQSEAVLLAARALGAPRIRVWAGRTGSAEVSSAQRARIVGRIQQFADRAGEQGLDVGLEFHGGTLTDEITSTLDLLEEIGRDNVRSYWQPHQDMPAAEALDTLRRALESTSTIHVFSWWPDHRRHPLSERGGLWREAFGLFAAEGSGRDALLEFVPDDDPAVLTREAESLRGLIAAGVERAR